MSQEMRSRASIIVHQSTLLPASGKVRNGSCTLLLLPWWGRRERGRGSDARVAVLTADWTGDLPLAFAVNWELLMRCAVKAAGFFQE